MSNSENLAIRASGLTRRFGKATAVDNIDLEVRAGEIFGFLGPNGAGKTTTVRMLCGLLAPTSGSATILGRDIGREVEAIKEEIGYVSQSTSLYDDLSVEENINFYGDLYGQKADAGELIIRYGFSDRENRLARELSGGYKQRLSLICALIHKPKLLFLDEPTAGIDLVTRKELWDIFYELAGTGVTLFVTTHYMEEAERCSRLAFIFNGRIVARGTPDEISSSLESERDVFEARSGFDPALSEKLRALDGIEMFSQFGNRLRIIAEDGRWDERALSSKLGVEVSKARPTVEDVFVSLSRRGL
jgi:ABC-2 type transport system ATP-binding protein